MSAASPPLPVAANLAARASLPDARRLEGEALTRYSRHLLLPGVGREGQTRLFAARVLVVGAGGLGSPICLYLAAAGVGSITVVDDDVVDLSNLQRQVLYVDADRGAPKAERAAARMRAQVPDIEVTPRRERVDASNAAALVLGHDVVVDGTDNLPTRYALADACARAGVPYVYGSVHRFEGQVAVFYPPHGACYRCLFPTPPPPEAVPSCAEAGVLGVLPGLVGTLQATQALELLLGHGEPLVQTLLTIDASAMRFHRFATTRDPACIVCGASANEQPSPDAAREGAPAQGAPEVTPHELARMRDADERYFLLDVRSPQEADLCAIAGATLMPVHEVATRAAELPRDLPIVAYCKSGARSARVVKWLQSAGFSDARSLAGGILGWIDAVDPSLPRY